jgi:hypothetical protein
MGLFQKLWYSFWGSVIAEWNKECNMIRMLINNNFGKKWFPDGFKQLFSGAFTSSHCGKALEFTVLTPIWTTNVAQPFLVPIFFIYNHACHVPLFLSLSTTTPPKWIFKILEKNSFIFYFSQILKLWFFIFIL